RRRHTRLQGDWSSDVCSCDLGLGRASFAALETRDKPAPAGKAAPVDGPGVASLVHRVRIDVPFDGTDASRISMPGYTRVVGQGKDRKSVVEGERAWQARGRTI